MSKPTFKIEITPVHNGFIVKPVDKTVDAEDVHVFHTSQDLSDFIKDWALGNVNLANSVQQNSAWREESQGGVRKKIDI